MKIVTAGYRYLDIDAYGGCIAYAALLRAQGHEAQAVCTAVWNESISRTIRSWQAPLLTSYEPLAADTFTLIDISEAEYFEKFVDIERIEAIIDHHPGFEAYWQQRIGAAAQIEYVGAACTLVYEHWQAAGLIDKIGPLNARLLIAGILDNTLNFGAKVTTERDRVAYAELLKRANLPAAWPAQYFTECQESILADLRGAIVADTKSPTFASLPGKLETGQLVVWDAEQILHQHLDTVKAAMAEGGPEWLMNLVDVSQGRSYFICTDSRLQAWLSGLLAVTFDGAVAQADRLWLRKEILKQDQQAAQPTR